jgi:RlmA, N-terminal
MSGFRPARFRNGPTAWRRASRPDSGRPARRHRISRWVDRMAAAGLTEPRCASERGFAMGGGRPAERRFTVGGSGKSVTRCHRGARVLEVRNPSPPAESPQNFRPLARRARSSRWDAPNSVAGPLARCLLRCPVCRLDLIAGTDALVCRNRHSFDLAREGYVNLLPGRRRQPVSGGDSREQLRHRTAFLGAGHFDGLAPKIVEHIQQSDTKPIFGEWRILDAGCGTGHHLARVTEALPPPVVGIGLDISKGAARQAARRWPTLVHRLKQMVQGSGRVWPE